MEYHCLQHCNLRIKFLLQSLVPQVESFMLVCDCVCVRQYVSRLGVLTSALRDTGMMAVLKVMACTCRSFQICDLLLEPFDLGRFVA